MTVIPKRQENHSFSEKIPLDLKIEMNQILKIADKQLLNSEYLLFFFVHLYSFITVIITIAAGEKKIHK